MRCHESGFILSQNGNLYRRVVVVNWWILSELIKEFYKSLFVFQRLLEECPVVNYWNRNSLGNFTIRFWLRISQNSSLKLLVGIMLTWSNLVLSFVLVGWLCSGHPFSQYFTKSSGPEKNIHSLECWKPSQCIHPLKIWWTCLVYVQVTSINTGHACLVSCCCWLYSMLYYTKDFKL